MPDQTSKFTGGNTPPTSDTTSVEHGHLGTALHLADRDVPITPLRRDKKPFGNCPGCKDSRCGGRPNMLSAGTCTCPHPCHGWAAATTDLHIINSPTWAPAWREAVAVAYHPGGCGLTVVDLDDTAAVIWARENLPATRTVQTTRGQHWIYLGDMRSSNAVRPGIDIKSRAAYVVWRGPGTGTMTRLPGAVLDLAVREEATQPAPVASSPWARTGTASCHHTEKFVRTGLDRGIQQILARPDHSAGTALYAAARFVAKQHADCPGTCGTEHIAAELITAAVSVGIPHKYAVRQVARGGLLTTGATA